MTCLAMQVTNIRPPLISMYSTLYSVVCTLCTLSPVWQYRWRISGRPRPRADPWDSSPGWAGPPPPPPAQSSLGAPTEWRSIVEGYIQKRRQRSSLLFGGCVLESHLAARMIWRKVFGRTSILGGWWFGVVLTRRSLNYSEASITPSVHFSIRPILQIILALNM